MLEFSSNLSLGSKISKQAGNATAIITGLQCRDIFIAQDMFRLVVRIFISGQ